MAESTQGVALELTKIILAEGGSARINHEKYSEDNVLRVYKAALDVVSGAKDGAA
jgi:hypothetical protein